MKTSDIALVVLLSAVSVVISYWLGNLILGDPNSDTYEITYVDSVSAELRQPDDETFYPGAINPTVEVIIGQCSEEEDWDAPTQRCIPKSEKQNEKKDGGGDENHNGDDNPGV